MEMPKLFTVADTIKIVVIAFAFIWAANKLLAKMGQSQLASKPGVNAGATATA